MSLTATLANALSGLTVAQRALSVTANNVANANTEGYVRKVLGQEAVFIGSRGAGVQASEITPDHRSVPDRRGAAPGERGRPERNPRALPGPVAGRVRRPGRRP